MVGATWLEVKIILRFRYLLLVGLALPSAWAGRSPAETSTTPDGHTVEIFYGKPLVRSTDAMVADLGVAIFPEDLVRSFPDPSWGLGSKISVTRATPVWINDGGNKSLVRTFKKTIGELLEEKGLVLGVQDSITPALETGLLAEGTVTITRVEETEVVEHQAIPFKTVTHDDSNLLEYTTDVAQKGKNGTKAITYKVRRENGVEVSRIKLGEEVTADPVEEIVRRGTKPLPVYQTGIASWYNHPRYDGNFAAHPTLPFGTKVLVKNAANPSKTVTVTIVDRGPWGAGRVIDLEPSAFKELAPLGAGLASVTLHVIP